MKLRIILTALTAMAAGAPASAQIRSVINWDAPMFFAPRPSDDLGLYVVKSDGSLDDATGLQAIWRQTGNLNLGVRAGVGDLSNAGNTILLGAELMGGLNSLAPGAGIDISWNLGAGAVFGDGYTVFSVPFGASVGLRLGSGSVQVAPYVHPRVSLDVVAVDDANGDEVTNTDGAFALDLGADVNLGQRFILRAGYSLGDRDAFGLGIAMRWPRGVSVVR